MFVALLCLGLIATAFAFSPSSDIRGIKMTVAVLFAIALGAAELYKHGFRPFRNKWLLILIAYVPVSIWIAPPPTIYLVGVNVSGFWYWEPFLQILAFFFMATAIASYDFTEQELNTVFKTISWCGVLTAFYVVLQRFDMDQFFVHTTGNKVEAYAGFIGNPTLTAPFIAMTVPFMIFHRSWWMLPIALAGIVFPDSQMAFGGLLAGMLFLFASKGPRRFVVFTSLGVVMFLALVIGYQQSDAVRKLVADHERFSNWTQIAKDIQSPIAEDIPRSFPLTGRGLGSFKYVYHIQHPGTEESPNRFQQAHNDYLEWAYSCGIVGLALLLFAIFRMVSANFSVYKIFTYGESELSMTLLSSFIIIAVVAFGTFVWQIGTTVYYTTLLIGLLHNPNFSLQNRGEK